MAWGRALKMAGPRYSIIPADALADDRITDLHLRILAILGSHSDGNGWLQINQKTLAARAKKTRETINRAIRDLVEFGYVRKFDRIGDDNRRLISKYQVVMDRDPVDEVVDVDPVTPTSQGVCDPRVTGYVTSGDHRVCDPQTSQQDNDLYLERPLCSKEQEARESGFDTWWREYPHKVAKGDAKKAFARAAKKVSLAILLDGVKAYIAAKPVDRPWCNPATWLNGERWLDQPSTAIAHGELHGRVSKFADPPNLFDICNTEMIRGDKPAGGQHAIEYRNH
ncbi:hypothetical protein MesoLj113c_14510 [Mesorhizobium sp. 113-3-9]|uniref:helix-turn-helix domain-containing protein n=1 Tax=Mesorhizobium sp. 113-3-9 TaxID=2744517 RepID=UPI0019261B7D|nr:helix-turn-helix domain-containing protein [Mesorhizobium sp. 113-3-9]BCG85341.1 hypothetical protein MesoLj113c_14510 [Mesorhizobium sp. 113-3-9]